MKENKPEPRLLGNGDRALGTGGFIEDVKYMQ
jgi:hypothetical protein